MRDVSVDIGQVVLDGAPHAPRDAGSFGRLAELALQRRLEACGVEGWTDAAVESVVLPAISLPEGASDERMAESLADAVYGVIGRGGGPS